LFTRGAAEPPAIGMIAVDTNILVYAHRLDSEWNAVANKVVTELAEGTVGWGIPWPCMHEFLAVVTNRHVFKRPTPMPRALEQIDYWMESPSLRLLGETVGHWVELRAVVTLGRMSGGMVHDARVAAICMENGVRELWSADRDFSRIAAFPVRNPLIRS